MKQFSTFIESSDERKLGKSLPETGYEYKRVRIYRAKLKSLGPEFHPKDYITRNYKWALSHAEHVYAVENKPSIVIEKQVLAKDVYEAYNPGEYFYNGPTIVGDIKIEINDKYEYED